MEQEHDFREHEFREHSCFFYGTLMHHKILERVTGSNRHHYIPAILDGYCRSKLKGLDYPGIIQQPGSSVHGMLVKHITPAELERLDLFEGDEYVVQSVHVSALENGSVHPCLAYVFMDHSLLEHVEWEFDTFEKEKIHHWTDQTDETEYSMLCDQDRTTDGTGGRAFFQPPTPQQ